MRSLLKTIVFTGILATLIFAHNSCIKDEPLNAECDIEYVKLRVDNPEQIFFQVSDTSRQVLYSDSIINFQVRTQADLTALAPVFVLTEGATIEPASGSVQDFSQGVVKYTVTSQDGRWQRRYYVSFTPVSVTVSDTIKFDYESYDLEPKNHLYYLWYNTTEVSTFGETFATGNQGYAMAMSTTAKPEDYPTVPMVDGYDGHGLRLVTRSTGPFGLMGKKPIASGNIFIGEFDMTYGLNKPLLATRFGKPFNQRPVKVTGYYKYKPGSVFQIVENGQIKTIDRTDQGSIYAVFYRNHDSNNQPVMLTGDNVQTHPSIVALAKVAEVKNTSEWTAFEMEFKYTSELDPKILSEMGYSLTIVFASSKDGDLFEGAIDSELCIDKVRLICSHEE